MHGALVTASDPEDGKVFDAKQLVELQSDVSSQLTVRAAELPIDNLELRSQHQVFGVKSTITCWQ